jgi:hypothetical protein
MRNYTKFYIDGKWVDPVVAKTLDVINPANEEAASPMLITPLWQPAGLSRPSRRPPAKSGSTC